MSAESLKFAHAYNQTLLHRKSDKSPPTIFLIALICQNASHS